MELKDSSPNSFSLTKAIFREVERLQGENHTLRERVIDLESRISNLSIRGQRIYNDTVLVNILNKQKPGKKRMTDPLSQGQWDLKKIISCAEKIGSLRYANYRYLDDDFREDQIYLVFKYEIDAQNFIFSIRSDIGGGIAAILAPHLSSEEELNDDLEQYMRSE